MSEFVVYKQEELNDALRNGIKNITLCSGIYETDVLPNVRFKRIGPVKVSVNCTKAEAEAQGMVFEDIYPQYKHLYAFEDIESLMPVTAVSSGSVGVLKGSSQIGSGSFGQSDYYHEYEFQYETSFVKSGTSFFKKEYRLLSSTANDFEEYTEDIRTVHVFGYGINLI